jgi:hypothetical protein
MAHIYIQLSSSRHILLSYDYSLPLLVHAGLRGSSFFKIVANGQSAKDSQYKIFRPKNFTKKIHL